MTTGQSPQKLTVDASTAPLSASTTHYSYEESDGHRTPVGVAPPAPFTAPAASDDGDLNKPEPCQFPNISMNLPEPVLGRSVSTSRERAQMLRKGDNIELLRVEKVVSRADSQSRHHDIYRPLGSTHNLGRSETPIDELSDSTGPTNGGRKGAWKPPAQPSNSIAKFIKKVHGSSWLIRYFTYIVPVTLVIAIPLIVGSINFRNRQDTVGGVYLLWFMVWIEIIWLSLWAGRVVSKLIPYPVGIIAGALTNGSKKWRDMAKMLGLPSTIFFWALAVYVSFLPIMQHHHKDGNTKIRPWEKTVNIIILCCFVGAVLNLIEKIMIQLIAISFHSRTYADRIELNKFQIASLSKLYRRAKEKEFELGTSDFSAVALNKEEEKKKILALARLTVDKAFTKVGDVGRKVVGDFTGGVVKSSSSPHQVILALLQSTEGSNVLARRLYRAYLQPGKENIEADDLGPAFSNNEEAEAAFSMFDHDLNGDISCEEMELSCVEIGRERKVIAASLKDLDSVVGKFDDCLVFIVVIIVVMVFLAMISTTTAGALTSASTSVLALSWLFSATAQEFLASLIFVFIKHPFDVGDRVDVYNTSGTGLIGTFYVREIALMYTEFKRVEGHVVQAPNSLLNTLFILNMRRSGCITEAIPIIVKFGTTIQQIDDLRARLLEFVMSEKREYQGKILTELRDIPNMHSVTLNVVFFYKSNWQNELVRLNRRNKFMCTLMCNVSELGIESPNMRWPGQKPGQPIFLQSIGEAAMAAPGPGPETPQPPGSTHEGAPHSAAGILHNPSISFTRADSIRGKKVDFSLGVKGMMAMDDSGDVFDDRPNMGTVPQRALKSVTEELEGEARDSGSHHTRDSRRTSIESRSSSLRSSMFRRKTKKERSDEEVAMPVMPQATHRPAVRKMSWEAGGPASSSSKM